MLNGLLASCNWSKGMARVGFVLQALTRSVIRKHPPQMSSRPKVLIITGPTAVGKSATALKLCKHLNGEIISADSVQVYKHLDIGSNKASLDEQAEVKHHMLDIADPSIDDFSAGDFFRAARVAIEEVHSRDKLPIVVGGTMMYVRWLIYGRPATPRAPHHARERAKVIVDSVNGNWDAAIALLAERDPKRAEKLSPNDWYRLGRAFEVLETTGVAITELPLQGGAPNSEVNLSKLDYDFRCVFLFGERVTLNRRIDERCEEMILPRCDVDGHTHWEELFQRSVLTEVSSLLVEGGLRVARTSPSRAIGYRQTILYLVGRALSLQGKNDEERHNSWTSDDAKAEFRAFVETFQSATRGYAKQQTSWFRKEDQFHWVYSGAGAVQEILDMVRPSRDEFEGLQTENVEQQGKLREDMIAQGKGMKTYIGKKLWLQEESEIERQAIRLAEQRAGTMADAIDTEELERMREILNK